MHIHIHKNQRPTHSDTQEAYKNTMPLRLRKATQQKEKSSKSRDKNQRPTHSDTQEAYKNTKFKIYYVTQNIDIGCVVLCTSQSVPFE